MDKTAVANQIIAHALPHIPFDGWTEHVLLRAAAEAGLGQDAVARVFPQGHMQAIEHWVAQADAAMQKEYQKLDATGLKHREKIERVIELRLKLHAPHREAVRRAIALLNLPQHWPMNLRLLSRTMDAMWRCVGDQSTDFSYYTKRMSLAAIYTATVMFWLQDESTGQQETTEFCRRRLDNLMAFHTLKRRFAA